MSKIIIGSSIGVFLGLWLFIASVVEERKDLRVLGDKKVQVKIQTPHSYNK
jgi:hypothetical protein